MKIFTNLKRVVVKGLSHFYKRDKKLWIFGEWFGKRCCDNSLYLANFVVENYSDITAVWIAEKDADLSLLDKRVKVIEKNTEESIKLCKKAGVVIMNQGWTDLNDEYINYFGGAVTINLWHGVPWKKIFMDSFKFKNKFKKFVAKTLNKILEPKYYLALSDEFGEILEKSVPTKKKNVILAGYPRNSLFYKNDIVKEKKEKIIHIVNEKFNKNFKDIKIITYMPTFRDKTRETFSFNNIINNTELLEILKLNKAIVIEKAHFVNRENEIFENKKDYVFNINDISAQELLAASDMLITDYSSCFFDYLVLDRPIVHYLYDYDYYVNDDRGVYYKKEDVVCGDVAFDEKQLINVIANNLKNPLNNKELRKLRRERFLQYESENACQQICDFIFKKIRVK